MAEAGGLRETRAEEEARRKLRQELRNQKEDVQKNKEVLCDMSTNRLDEAVKRLDNLLDRGDTLGDSFRRAKEVSAQAEILRTLTSYGVEATNKLVQQQQGRGPMELITALRAAFVHTSDPQRDGEEDPMAFCWSELAAATEHLRRPARGMHCMLGPMDAKPKERKAPVQRQRKQALGELEKPEEVQQIQSEEKQETDRNMTVMWDILREQPNRTAQMVRAICNHRSFAQTVENHFALSFLVRDNHVELLDTEDGYYVRVIEGRQGPGGAAANKPNNTSDALPNQYVPSMHMDEWDEMCEYLRPEECLMPHRDYDEPAGGGAAGGWGHAARTGEEAWAPQIKRQRTGR
ncbi:hypothetical protein Agub_g2254 [Astrephomene gubernaculifera]|uniref:Non-structural maintenance of chromosomes element 4 n=1 Tax=Astrephomene gubernaculifera TaxID=47775 RepID=A0AAD3HI89_9CHLO|nr:hypothetical protein Agub_g2254 [Astrephomene gubernaculifera]